MKPIDSPVEPSTSGTHESVVVTGATGFLGQHLVRALLDEGRDVTALGRDLATGLKLAKMGARFLPVDLTHPQAVIGAVDGADTVVHAGAMSTAWGSFDDFYATNVRGTAHVIEACRRAGVARLVYISSPSVVSRFENQYGLDDSEPYPDGFVSLYSHTKKLGEDLVNQAHADQGLGTVILRPKAIYGPGDQALLPRIVEALSKQRLPLIGDGDTVTNLTHVSDVVRGIQMALTSPGAPGGTFTITGGEDVRLWDLIETLAVQLSYQPPSRRLTTARAMSIAGAMEHVWKTLHLGSEPPLTRYKVGILAYSQTYDISRARTVLGYQPTVSLDDGLRELVETCGAMPHNDARRPAVARAQSRKAETVPPGELDVTFYNAGTVRTLGGLFTPDGRWKPIDVPNIFAVLRHPTQGIVLFDSGYSPRFHEATRRFPYSLYRVATPVRISESETAAAQLAKDGVSPDAVNWIVVSHFDPDHYGGLKDFPNARIVCSWRAWKDIAGKSGIDGLRHRILPGHLPDDLTSRLHLIPDVEGPPIPPFAGSHDLFGDGTVQLVELPGHKPGQLGAFVTSRGTDYFLAADSIWTRDGINRSRITGRVHGLIAADRKAQDRTYAQLDQLQRTRPGVVIVPSHCPNAAREIGCAPELSG